jgi:methylmalonyl-CoA mutase N-terminal domain/subunit
VGVPVQRIDDEAGRRQVERVQAHKAAQDRMLVDSALEAVKAAAASDSNLLPPMREALRAGATLGQIANTLRALYGEYRAVS